MPLLYADDVSEPGIRRRSPQSHRHGTAPDGDGEASACSMHGASRRLQDAAVLTCTGDAIQECAATFKRAYELYRLVRSFASRALHCATASC